MLLPLDESDLEIDAVADDDLLSRLAMVPSSFSGYTFFVNPSVGLGMGFKGNDDLEWLR